MGLIAVSSDRGRGWEEEEKERAAVMVEEEEEQAEKLLMGRSWRKVWSADTGTVGAGVSAVSLRMVELATHRVQRAMRAAGYMVV